MMNYSIIILFVSLVSLCLADEGYIKTSIGPLADCSGKAESLGKFIKQCHSRCIKEEEPKQIVGVGVFKSVTTGPTVVECSKMILTQRFTKTWTFSTVVGELVVKRTSVTLDECKNAIKENCPTYECDHREPDALEPEYHYGSDTVVELIVISLVSMPSVLAQSKQDLTISPMSSKLSFSSYEEYGYDQEKIYLWRDQHTPTVCPFEQVKLYKCDEYDRNGQTYFSCAGGGMMITEVKGSEFIYSNNCPGIKVSEEGFLYNLVKGESIGEGSGRLGISETHKLEADGVFLRHRIQQISAHLDSEICANQCEILALETRIPTDKTPLVRIGMEYILSHGNGTGTKCKALHGCKVSQPKLLCGNPPRVGITCTMNSGLWDPFMAYIMEDHPCRKPDSLEKLIVSLGSEHYVVDDDLTIMAPRNVSHGIYPTSEQSLHMSGLQLDIQTLQDLKEPWTKSKSSLGRVSKSVEKNTKIESPSFTVGSFITGAFVGIQEYFSSIEHIIGITVIMCALMIGGLIVSRTWNYVAKHNRKKDGHTSGVVYKSVNKDDSVPVVWI